MTLKYKNVVKAQEYELFISKKLPFLSASPDQLIAQLIIVEVKYPYIARELVINPITVSHLYCNAEVKFALKESMCI